MFPPPRALAAATRITRRFPASEQRSFTSAKTFDQLGRRIRLILSLQRTFTPEHRVKPATTVTAASPHPARVTYGVAMSGGAATIADG